MREISDKAWESLKEEVMKSIYDLIIAAADRGDSGLTIVKSSKNIRYICDELKREGFEALALGEFDGLNTASIRVSWRKVEGHEEQNFDTTLASQMCLRTELAKNDEYKRQRERQIQEVRKMASKGERVWKITEGSPDYGNINSKYKGALKEFFEHEGFGIRDITEYSFVVEW